MRDFLVAGNWKMNGSSAGNAELVAGIIAGAPRSDRVRLVICPPFPYLAPVAAQAAGSGVAVGAQTVSQHESGAFTGEVAPGMLRDIGCEYVIVGHSERRELYGETSATVAEKVKAALDAGLKPIVCVGETLEQRESGSTESVVEEQLGAVIDKVGIAAFATAVVAYEPVWAIGTGKTASPEQAQEVHRHIRALLAGHESDIAAATQILYGGSMKGENAAGLLAMPDIDGGLIGGASLKAADFLAIAQAAAQG
ncbi:MAG: triose-phosphate isomerase [Gammaproteobacteria bacterium]|nr:triose-phosphate isomerase [Gammaproteobacteria bacterium]MDH3373149.1 triose-phosphate isomerase [Gammaproteobacteria bacterium]MDH3408213.1 triose-phosphate isomerase [Gammaproteobacteria bacterium]MDH3552242.1 triose-phosphate isomerase [Gammaproteobacteria bacterium]